MDYQKSFQEFMLGKSVRSAELPSTPSPVSVPRKKDNSPSKAKQFIAAFKAFSSQLQEWVDVDEQLRQVLLSVANLRDRIFWANDERTKIGDMSKHPAPRWKDYGYQTANNYLTADDVDLALTHGILQHERMLSNVRTLTSSLGQIQESMGRRLDKLMFMAFEDECNEVVIESQGWKLADCQTVFIMTSEELYRKQIILQKVLDSACSDMILVDDQVSSDADNPRAIIRDCLMEWSSQKERKEEWVIVQSILDQV